MSFAKCSLSVLVIVCVLCSQVFAKSSLGDWSNVQRLKIPTQVIVKTKPGAEYEGQLRSVTDDALFIETFQGVGGQLLEVKRETIREVRRRTFSRGAATALGVGIGIGVGAGIGGIMDARSKSNEDPGLATLIFAFVGGLNGLLLSGPLSKKTKRVYVAS